MSKKLIVLHDEINNIYDKITLEGIKDIKVDTLEVKDITMKLNSIERLEYKSKPKQIDDNDLKIISRNPEIVDIGENNIIYGKNVGETELEIMPLYNENLKFYFNGDLVLFYFILQNLKDLSIFLYLHF